MRSTTLTAAVALASVALFGQGCQSRLTVREQTSPTPAERSASSQTDLFSGASIDIDQDNMDVEAELRAEEQQEQTDVVKQDQEEKALQMEDQAGQ